MENPALFSAGVSVTLRTLGTSLVVRVVDQIPRCSLRGAILLLRSGIRVLLGVDHLDALPSVSTPTTRVAVVLQATFFSLVVMFETMTNEALASAHGTPPVVGVFVRCDRWPRAAGPFALSERAAPARTQSNRASERQSQCTTDQDEVSSAHGTNSISSWIL